MNFNPRGAVVGAVRIQAVRPPFFAPARAPEDDVLRDPWGTKRRVSLGQLRELVEAAEAQAGWVRKPAMQEKESNEVCVWRESAG